MEIFDFLELNARRIVALAVLAVLVAVPTAALLLRGTTQYRATATVRLAPFLPAGTNAGLQSEIEDGFQAAFGVAAVRSATAQVTGVRPTDLRDHLQVSFPNAATTAEITYTDTAARAPLVVRAAAIERAPSDSENSYRGRLWDAPKIRGRLRDS